MKALKGLYREFGGFTLLYVINFTVFILLYYYIDGFTAITGFLYFILLSVFFIFLFLIFMYNRRKAMYRRLTEKGSMEESVIYTLDSVISGEKRRVADYEKWYNDHLIFINRWVHYIKTPLSVIHSITQEDIAAPVGSKTITAEDNRASSSQVRTEEIQEKFFQIQAEADKILDGVNTALNYARATDFVNDFRVEPVNIYDLAVSVINGLKRYFIRRNLFPEVEIPNDLVLMTDKKWIYFILFQLLTNAIKYSLSGGRVRLYSIKEENTIILSVEDFGIGIPKGDLNRVFDLFFTGENGRKQGESTGIGLYLVKTICNKLNYSLSVSSVEGKGSVFSVKLAVGQEE